MEQVQVAVVGAGAAGMMAAGVAAQLGAKVTLFEKNDKVGRKIGITGKGRCNVTNQTDAKGVLAHTLRNPRFLYSALSAFPPEKTMDFFESYGVPLKTERGNRVFPMSDRAGDIVSALRRFLVEQKVQILHEPVLAVLQENGCITGVKTQRKTYPFSRVVLATGGASYPRTGSTGDGYAFARALGHTVTPIAPSLVPVTVAGKDCPEMMGLSLKNVTLQVLDTQTKRSIFAEQGEMLFTHFGVSGPLVLSASAQMQKLPLTRYQLILDLKPALDEITLDARLQRELSENPNRQFSNLLATLLPQKMIPVFARRAEIELTRKANSITRIERKRILALLKHMEFSVTGFRPIAEAIVTAGGVDVKEVFPKTMESKRICGLFFAGELLDIDAYTGGFNLQLAFATGVAAGKGAAMADKIQT